MFDCWGNPAEDTMLRCSSSSENSTELSRGEEIEEPNEVEADGDISPKLNRKYFLVTNSWNNFWPANF